MEQTGLLSLPMATSQGEEKPSFVLHPAMWQRGWENNYTYINVIVSLCAYMSRYISKSKVRNYCWGWFEGSLFNSYYTKVGRKALLLFLNCMTLPLICTLYSWVLSKETSSTIFRVFSMTQPRIEPLSLRPLANTQLSSAMNW